MLKLTKIDADTLVSAASLAAVLGYTHTNISSMAQTGLFVKRDGSLLLCASVQAFLRNAKGKTAVVGGENVDLEAELAKEKVLLTKAQRQTRQLELQVLAGTVVSEDHARVMFLMLGKLVAEWCDGLRDQLERKTASPAHLLEAVEGCIDDLRGELHAKMDRYIDAMDFDTSLPEPELKDATEPA